MAGMQWRGIQNSKGAGGYDMWVMIKLDASGNKTWDKTFGGSSDDSANAIVQTTDGGYAVAGYTKSMVVLICGL